jgi:hypothetical protein
MWASSRVSGRHTTTDSGGAASTRCVIAPEGTFPE